MARLPVRPLLLTAVLGLALGAGLSACPLPSNVRYRCETDGTCAQAGHRCASDGFCYPGECTPRDTTALCAQVECGLVSDGCGGTTDCGKWCPEGFECGVAQANACGVARVCTPAGWCWENPLPQGATLYAAFRGDERHTWFVGEMGTVLKFDGEKSTLEDVPLTAPATFFGVHGTSARDVYVVGEGGLIFHYDGSAWTKEGISTGVTGTLRGVLALADGRAVAVGEDGRALYREPTAAVDRRWREATTGVAQDLSDVTLRADGGVVAITNNGQVLVMRADQLVWTSGSSQLSSLGMGTSRTVVDVDGTLYVGGTGGPLGGLFQLQDDGGWAPAGDGGREVHDLAAWNGALWVAGRGLAQRLEADGTASPNLGAPAVGLQPTTWRAVAPLGAGEALVASDRGLMAVARPDAGQLLMRSLGSVRDVNAVCGFGPGALYGASTVENPFTNCPGTGCRPRVLERLEAPAGAYWRVTEPMPLGGTLQLLGCYAYGPDRVWLMGNDSKYYRQSGGTWEYGDFGFTGITGAYIAGWGTPDAGFTFLRDGERTLNVSPDGFDNYQEVSVPGPGRPLNGVWGLGTDDRILVGDEGVVLRYLAGQWQQPLATGFTDDLLAVHGATLAQGGQRYVAAGAMGRVFLLESGEAASSVALADAPRLTGSWVSSSGTAWVVGYVDQPTPRAFAARQAGPGAPFVPVPLWAERELRGVFGVESPDGGHSVWVVGERGLILRHDGP